jgi:predicted porin
MAKQKSLKGKSLKTNGIAAGLLWGIAFASFSCGASAADADVGAFPLKAPPVIPDLTWHGITLIGAIDVSVQHEQYGAPYAGMLFSPAALIAPYNRSSQWIVAPNQSLTSYIGVKVEEPVTSDLNFIARAEMGFIPTTGEIANGPESLQKNNGIPLSSQTVSGDAPRAGQILNGEAFVGFDERRWGIIHVGRNRNVSIDMISAYDPLASAGFSLLIGYPFLAGQGATDTAILDSSIKYMNSYGPFRTELIYGRPGTTAKDFYQGTIGFVRPNFSVDLIAGHSDDSVSLFSLAGPANFGSNFLGASVFDTDMYGGFGKYAFDLAGNGPLTTPESKFIISGGYQQVVFMNPADGGFAPGHTTVGGYEIGPFISTNGSAASGVVNYSNTGGNRRIGSSFVAGKYEYDSQLSFALVYYRFDRNSNGLGVNGIPGIIAPSFSTKDCSSSAFSNCAGSLQAVAFRTDYQWTKNLMLYAGVVYSKASGGFAFSFLQTSTINETVGVRFTF